MNGSGYNTLQWCNSYTILLDGIKAITSKNYFQNRGKHMEDYSWEIRQALNYFRESQQTLDAIQETLKKNGEIELLALSGIIQELTEIKDILNKMGKS